MPVGVTVLHESYLFPSGEDIRPHFRHGSSTNLFLRSDLCNVWFTADVVFIHTELLKCRFFFCRHPWQYYCVMLCYHEASFLLWSWILIRPGILLPTQPIKQHLAKCGFRSPFVERVSRCLVQCDSFTLYSRIGSGLVSLAVVVPPSTKDEDIKKVFTQFLFHKLF